MLFGRSPQIRKSPRKRFEAHGTFGFGPQDGRRQAFAENVSRVDLKLVERVRHQVVERKGGRAFRVDANRFPV